MHSKSDPMLNGKADGAQRVSFYVRKEHPTTHWLSPSTSFGALVGVILVGSFFSCFGLWTNPNAEILPVVTWTIILCSPVFVLAQLGHFGTTRWEFPSLGASVVLLWMLNTIPSAAAIGDYRLTTYSDEGQFWGRIAIALWYWCMVIGLGRVSIEYDVERSLRVDFRDLIATLCVLLPVFLVTGFLANQSGTISSWNRSSEVAETGSAMVIIPALFGTLAQLLMGIGGLLLASKNRKGRVVGILLVICGAGGVFLTASRTWMILGATLCIGAYRMRGRRVGWKVVFSSIFAIGFIIGPLTWGYRLATTGESKGNSSAASLALESMIVTATDPAERALSNEVSNENLSGRMTLSPQLFTTVDEVLGNGPNWSPTFMAGIANFVPSILWSKKNDVAASFSLEAQLAKTGRFPETDLAPTPILESVFQLGLFLGPLVGLLYGILTKILTKKMFYADNKMWQWIFFAQIFLNVSESETTTSNFIVGVRSSLAVTLGIFTLSIMIRHHKKQLLV